MLRTSLLHLRLVAALLLISLLAAPQARAADEKASQQAPPKGLRLFICGHSFHVFVYNGMIEAAANAGIKDQTMVGVSRIGGSRVIQHWDVPDEKNQLKAALKEGKVDLLTLAPIWLPDEGIEKFARLGFEHNPNIRITVQEYWLPNDTYEPKYPLDTRKKVDHDATDVAALAKSQAAYDHDLEEYCKAINQKLGKDVIVMVPVGKAAVALRERIVAGKAPGLKKQWDLFRDTWGHAQPPLAMLSIYCHYAVIYHRSPVGLPVPSMLAKMEKLTDTEKADLNRLLQELAWDAVTHDPMTGVKADSAGR